MKIAHIIKCSLSQSRLTPADFESESRSTLFDRLTCYLKQRPVDQIVQEEGLNKRILKLNPLQQGYFEGLKAHFGVTRQIKLVEGCEFASKLEQTSDHSVDCHSCTDGTLVCFGCNWPKRYPIYIAVKSSDILHKIKSTDSGQALLPEIALELAHIRCREKSQIKLLLDLASRIGALVFGILVAKELTAIWGPFSGVLVGIGIGGIGGDWLSARALKRIDVKQKRKAEGAVAHIKIFAQIAAEIPLKPASNNEFDVDKCPICPITLSPIPLQERAYYLHFNQAGYPLVTIYSREEIIKWLVIKSLDPQTNKTMYNLLDFKGRILYVAPFGARINPVNSIPVESDQSSVRPVGFEYVPLKERVFHLHFDTVNQPLVTMYRRKKLLHSFFENRNALLTKKKVPVFMDFLGRVIHKNPSLGLPD